LGAVNDRVFTNKRPRSRRDSTAPVAHHVRKCWAREAIKAYHRHQADRRRKLVQHGAQDIASAFSKIASYYQCSACEYERYSGHSKDKSVGACRDRPDPAIVAANICMFSSVSILKQADMTPIKISAAPKIMFIFGHRSIIRNLSGPPQLAATFM